MEMARCDDQDFCDVCDAKSHLRADLRRPDQNDLHSRPAHNSNSAEQGVDRYGHSCTEPTPDLKSGWPAPQNRLSNRT